MQGIRMLWLTHKHLAIQHLGSGQIAALVLTHGSGEQIGNGGLLSHLMGHACTKIAVLSTSNAFPAYAERQ